MTAFIKLNELSVGGQSAYYPKSITDMYEVREFIGRAGKTKSNDMRVGHVTLLPGANYPGHHHPAPEVYIQISGYVEWVVGNEKKSVEGITAINIPSNTTHAMQNIGKESAELIYFWFIPSGAEGELFEDATLDV